MTGEYAIAVHAVVYLSHKDTLLSSDAIAQNVCTNPARIRKIMSMLKKAGIVATKEGLEGGYYLLKKSSEITLRAIGEAVQVEYVSASWKSGSQDLSCLIASGMADIMDGIYDNLNELCRESLEQITISDIENQIFGPDSSSNFEKGVSYGAI